VLSERVERAAAAADEDEDADADEEEEEGGGEGGEAAAAAAEAAERASERRYVRRLRGGLVALQKVNVVIAALVASGDAPLSLALRAKLYEQGASLVAVREVLGELAERLDDSDDEKAAEKRGLAALVDAVGRVAGHEDEGAEEGAAGASGAGASGASGAARTG
jgi:hypothetical protein